MARGYMMLHALLGNRVLVTARRLGVVDWLVLPTPRYEVSPASYPYQKRQDYLVAGSTHSPELIPSRMQLFLRLIRHGDLLMRSQALLMRAWLAGIMLAIFGLSRQATKLCFSRRPSFAYGSRLFKTSISRYR